MADDRRVHGSSLDTPFGVPYEPSARSGQSAWKGGVVRICFYTHTALPLIGGQEILVDSLAREYTRQGHETVVLAPRPARFLRLGDEALPYRVVRHPRFISTRRLVSWYRWWLLRLHRQCRFEVVHCQGIYPAGYLAALCRDSLDCPLIITSQGEDVPSASHHLEAPEIYRRHVRALEAADALVAISRFTRDGFIQMCPAAAARVVDIANCADVQTLATPIPRPAGLDGGVRANEYVLFLGRLHPRKGVDVLLKALASLPATGGVQLVIAGDGKQRPLLEALADDLRLRDRVRFVGMAQGPLKTYLLQNSLCLAAPSVGWEGQPLTVLESFATGRPVIASDLPGFTDLVQPGKTGWLVPQQSPQALATVLRTVFADRGQVARLGAQAYQVAQLHSWQACARQHLDLYDKLAARRHGLAA